MYIPAVFPQLESPFEILPTAIQMRTEKATRIRVEKMNAIKSPSILANAPVDLRYPRSSIVTDDG